MFVEPVLPRAGPPVGSRLKGCGLHSGAQVSWGEPLGAATIDSEFSGSLVWSRTATGGIEHVLERPW